MKILRGAMLVLLCMGSLSGCDSQAPPQQAPTTIHYDTVKEERLTLTNSLPGRVSAVVMAEVRPQVDGIILERLFEEGSYVTKGQVLYLIDPAIYEAEYNTAKANLAEAEANLNAQAMREKRYRALVKVNAISQQDLDNAIAAHGQARARIAKAKAQLEATTINLAYTRIKAPVSGRIGASAVTMGALVTANQPNPLATIRQTDRVYVDITQSSAETIQLRRALALGVISLNEIASDETFHGSNSCGKSTRSDTSQSRCLQGNTVEGVAVQDETSQGAVPQDTISRNDVSQNNTAHGEDSSREMGPEAFPGQMKSALVSLTLEDGSPYTRLGTSLEKSACSSSDHGAADSPKTSHSGRHEKILGHLLFSEIAVGETTGSVALRAIIDNPDGLLLPGMYVTATIEEGILDNAILIPQKSVFADSAGQHFVYVLHDGPAISSEEDGKDASHERIPVKNSSGTAFAHDEAREGHGGPPLFQTEQRAIILDRPVGNRWLVRAGLSAGEQVVVEGLQKVMPGEHVCGVPAQTRAESPAQTRAETVENTVTREGGQ